MPPLDDSPVADPSDDGTRVGDDRVREFIRERRPPSDHFDGRRFFNPGIDTDRGLGDLWRWRRSRRPAAWPSHLPHVPRPPPPVNASPGEVLLTYIGQATVLIQVAGCNILTDPIFSDRASPLKFAGPRRVRDPGLDLEQLPPIDIVLLSHNHYDHMDLPSLRSLQRRWAPRVVTGLGNGAYLERRRLPGAIELDWWESCRPRTGVEVSYVPAQHWSARTFGDRRRMLWGGHVVRTATATLFFAGDTGFGPHFAEIGRRFAPDVALLPIGAYEPRWFMSAQHMNPDEAVTAHRILGAGLSLGIHWGTFQLTDEAIDAPLVALEAAKAAQDVPGNSFVAPEFGETIRWSALP